MIKDNFLKDINFPKDIKKISQKNLKKLSDEVINSNASPESVRNMFQLKSIEGTDMKRSTHLENERKFKIP